MTLSRFCSHVAVLFFVLALNASALLAQTIITADGQTDTYTLFNNGFGGIAEETPDCAHPDFGPHITQQFDPDFNKPVFAFFIHVTPDNDRCINFDRQRNEVKVYDPSSDALKGFLDDTVSYSWAFKLDSGFQPSPNFTHIHQLKAVGGDDSSPVITLTPRSTSSGDILQLINVDSTGSTNILASTDLTPFKGSWVVAQETAFYDNSGTYSVTLTQASDGAVLFSWSGSADLWRNNTNYVRPKWGIYRSLNSQSFLRDEVVLYDQFCINKGGSCPNPTPGP